MFQPEKEMRLRNASEAAMLDSLYNFALARQMITQGTRTSREFRCASSAQQEKICAKQIVIINPDELTE